MVELNNTKEEKKMNLIEKIKSMFSQTRQMQTVQAYVDMNTSDQVQHNGN